LPPHQVEKAEISSKIAAKSEKKGWKNGKNSGKLFQIILQRAFYYIINAKKQNREVDFVGLMN